MPRITTDTPCKRCGFSTERHVSFLQHRKWCHQLPTPDELAAEYMSGDETLTEMAERYKSGSRTFINRLRLSRHYKPRRLKVQNSKSSGLNRGQNIAQDTRRRCVCGVLLDYPTVPVGDGERCGYCVAEAKEKVTA